MAQVSLNFLFSAVDKNVLQMTGKLGKGIQANSVQLRRMGMAAAAAGAAILGALALMIRETAKYGDEIAKAAQQTNTSVEALSGLRYAADRAGVGFEELTMALARQSRAAREAADGVATYKDAYDRLGISVKDGQGTLKTSEQLFLETAEALSKLRGSQEQTALAMDIFGRSGAKLIPLFNAGGEGIKKLMERAKELGLVMDEDTAKAAERFNDALADVKDSLKGAAIQAGQHLLPVIAQLAETVANAIGKFNQFADAHPILAKGAVMAAVALGSLLMVGGGLLILLAQLAPILTAVSGAGGLAGVAGAAGGAGTAIAGAGTAVAGLGTALAGLAAVALPLLAVAAAAAVAAWSVNRTWKEAIKAEEAFKGMEDSANSLAASLGKEAPKGGWWETVKGTLGMETSSSRFIQEQAGQAVTPQQVAAAKQEIHIHGNIYGERHLEQKIQQTSGELMRRGAYA